MDRLVRVVVALVLSAVALVWAPTPVHADTVALQGTVTANGQPVDQVAITVRNTGTNDVVAQTLSDPTGFYILTLQSGTYDIVASNGVLSKSISAYSLPVSRTLDIELSSPFVTISGTFVTADSQPIVGAEIASGCGGATSYHSTDADGRFAFQVLTGSENCWVVAWDSVAGRTGQFRTSVQATGLDLSTDLELDLRPDTMPLTIAVENPDGSPADVSSLAVDLADPVYTPLARQTLDVFDWESSVSGLANATFDVVAAPTLVRVVLADGRVLQQQVDASTVSSTTLVVPDASTLSGTFRTPTDGPAVNAPGTVDCGAGSIAFATDANGQFSLPVAPSPSCSVTLRSFEFREAASDLVDLYYFDVDLTADVDIDASFDTVDLTVDVIDENGDPATSVSRIVVSPVSTPVLPVPTGQLYVGRWDITRYTMGDAFPTLPLLNRVNVHLNDGQVIQQDVDTSVQTHLTVQLQQPSILTVTARTPFGELPVGSNVTLQCPGLLRFLSIGFDGQLVYPVTPRTGCNVSLTSIVERDGHRSDVRLSFRDVDLTSDVSLDAIVPTADFTVDVLNADGTPADVDRIDVRPWVGGRQVPTSPPAELQAHQVTQFGTPTATLPAVPGDSLVLVQLSSGALLERRLDVPADGGHVTLVLANPPLWLTGAPGTSNDGDSVDDLTEALAPNNGDGNDDGVPDYEQANVTSYPSSAGTYVTIEAPAGTTLGNVRTLDPATYSLPPQLVLPEGLTDFRVDGVTPGSDVTLKIFTSSAAMVIAYVKYQDGQLTILPFDRFTKFADRVEIRLTDGGPGDDDGVANGVIVDPGGVATEIPPVDGVAPVVTGTVSPAANAAGWHDSEVTVSWEATDAEPSSGGVTSPAVTVVSTEGADQSITSAEVCDAAANCAVGSVQVSIDLTAPTLEIDAPVSITTADALTITCAATDALSGVAVDCDDISRAAGSLPVGTSTFEFTATDVAGNTVTEVVSVTVIEPVPTNTAPVVSADMGVPGLQEIGFQGPAVVLVGSFADVEGNGPFTAQVRWTATGSWTNTILVDRGRFAAAWIYGSTSARTVTVRVCDAAGLCGTDDVVVRPNVNTKVVPLAQCVTDRGAGTPGGRYEARWGYRNPAAFAIAVPFLPLLENTFTSAPFDRGQPQVFLPGNQDDVFRTRFTSGTQTWKLNGKTATAKSNLARC